jgi:pimeloyl-ACP methyl ester carboxylesterase
MARRLAGLAACASFILCAGTASDARLRSERVCVADEHYEGMLARYKYVLVGRVEDRTDTPTGQDFLVKAIRVWKGDTRTLTLKDGALTYPMTLITGQVYVIFAGENPQDIDSCSPVIPTSDKRALKAIGRLDRARGLPPLALQKEDLPPPREIERPRGVQVAIKGNRTVQGDEYGRGDRGVVLASGARFHRWSWRRQAGALADAGFRVLAIDFIKHWPLDPKPPEAQLYLDVLDAVRYLRKNGARTVSIVGADFGGWAAGRAAIEAAPGEIDRLVLLAPTSIAEPERLSGRKLFVTTREDPAPDGSLRLLEIRSQYEKAPDPKQLLVLKGSAHAQFIFTTNEGERLTNEILRFLSEP